VLLALTFFNIFFAGLLAGEEFIVRFGVRRAIVRLADPDHIRIRQALIRALRIPVPILFFLALLSGAAVIYLGPLGGQAFGLRVAGVAALLLFIGVTLGGTVPINQAALDWSPRTPPDDWRTLVRRWERLDTIRTLAAVAAFACFLSAILY
jgi:uncharacterized membrane protein